MSEQWYVATLLMQIRVAGDQVGPFTCDEQIRLLRAMDESTAYLKAMEIGRNEEHAYQNMYGQTVTWKFVGLVWLDELMDQAIEDGVEIKSRLFSHTEPSNLAIRDISELHSSQS